MEGTHDKETLCHHGNPVNIIKRRKWPSQENKIVTECCTLNNLKIRGCREHVLGLWLLKDTFWVSEQCLVDQAYFFCLIR